MPIAASAWSGRRLRVGSTVVGLGTVPLEEVSIWFRVSTPPLVEFVSITRVD